MSTLNPNSGFYASPALEREAIERSTEKNCIESGNYLNFAYTDYGGEFLDIVFIDYFSKHYPENIVVEDTCYFGRNAIVFNTEKNPNLIDRYINETEGYLLGFEGVEDFHTKKEYEAFLEFVEFFIEDELTGEYSFDETKVKNWLHEEKYGCFGITTQGIDYNASELIKDLINADLITTKEQ